MTYKKGFMIGFVAGLFLIAVSTGFLEATQEAMEIAQTLGTVGLILALVITFIKPFKRGSVFNPTWDGFLTGFGAACKAVATARYGFRFP